MELLYIFIDLFTDMNTHIQQMNLLIEYIKVLFFGLKLKMLSPDLQAADFVAFLIALYVNVFTKISSPSFNGRDFSIVLMPKNRKKIVLSDMQRYDISSTNNDHLLEFKTMPEVALGTNVVFLNSKFKNLQTASRLSNQIFSQLYRW